MAHIKEPKDIDFIIKSEPLTEEERKAISEFIHEYKSKHNNKKKIKKPRLSSSNKKVLV